MVSPRERTRAYVQENAAKGVEHSLTLAQEQWQRLKDVLAGVSAEEVTFRPAAEDWTIAEVLQHLTLSLSYNRERIEAMSAGRPFTEPAYATGQLPEQLNPDFPAARDRFFADGDAIIALARGAQPGANLELTAPHAVFGAYNWVEWLVHISIHARSHTQQIQDVRSAYTAVNQAIARDVVRLDAGREAVRAYVAEQAERGLQHVTALVRAESQAIAAAIAGFSEEQGQLQPTADEFSALQVLQHLNGSYERSLDRLATLSSGRPWSASGRPAAGSGGIPEGSTTSFIQARAEFSAGAQAVLDVLTAAEPVRGLELTANHAAYGPFNWLQWAVYSHHVHTHDHVGQLRDLRTLFKGEDGRPSPASLGPH